MPDVNLDNQGITDPYHLDPSLDTNAEVETTGKTATPVVRKIEDAITSSSTDTSTTVGVQGTGTPVLSSQIETASTTTVSNPHVLTAGQTVAETMDLDSVKMASHGKGMPSIAFMKKLQEVLLALDQELKRIAADRKEIAKADPDNPDSPYYTGTPPNAALSVASGQQPGGPEGQIVTIQSQFEIMKQLTKQLQILDRLNGPFGGFMFGRPSRGERELASQLNNLMQKLGLISMKTSTEDFIKNWGTNRQKALRATPEGINQNLFNQQFNYAAMRAGTIATPFVAKNPDTQELMHMGTAVSLTFSGKPPSDYLNALLQKPALLLQLQESGLLPKDQSEITEDQVQNLQQTIQDRLTEIAKITKLTVSDLDTSDTLDTSEIDASSDVADAFKSNEDAVKAAMSQKVKDILGESGLPEGVQDTLLELFQTAIFIALAQKELNPSSPSSRESSIVDFLKQLDPQDKSELAAQLTGTSVGNLGTDSDNEALNSIVGLLLVTVEISVLFSTMNSKNPESPTLQEFLKDHPDLSPTMSALLKLSGMSDEDIDSTDVSKTLQSLNIDPGKVSEDPDTTELLRTTLKMLRQLLANLMGGGAIPIAIAHATTETSDNFGGDEEQIQTGSSSAA